MKKILAGLAGVCLLAACSKNKEVEQAKASAVLQQIDACNMKQVDSLNATKVTVANGIWGTVSEMKGNCMPVIGPGSGCSHCAIQRTVQIYQFTTPAQASAVPSQGGFYNSFSTQLVKQVVTDVHGFYQVDLPPGKYSVVIVENGKLYNSVSDAGGGIGGIEVTGGQQKYDFVSRYQATF